MRIDMIAFTQQGYRLGQKLERILNDEGEQARLAAGFGKEKQPLSQWCQRVFSESDALLFIGAAGWRCGPRPLSGQQNHRSRRPFSG